MSETHTLLPLSAYDHIIVSFSGGKDSICSILDLLERGVDPARIEAWHQCVDGRPGTPTFMDWPVTEAYCEAVAGHLGIPLRLQWREEGFMGELLKEDRQAHAVGFVGHDGAETRLTSDRSKVGTRLRWPAKAADLRTRWCSAALKIDVAARALNNDARFAGKRTLFLTGERREESTNRARYAASEPHRCHAAKRHVDHWRNVLEWDERRVWETIERHRIRPHPAYRLGFGRLSCMKCIFIEDSMWAANRVLDPAGFQQIADLEVRLGHTIDSKRTVVEKADRGRYEVPPGMEEDVVLAMGSEYPADLVVLDPWELPAGAYRRGGGPS